MRIFDYDDGDFLIKMSDNMAVSYDGHMMMKFNDNMAMDMNSGEMHIVSGWSNDEDEDDW